MTHSLPGYPDDAFSRRDETDDAIFYAKDRFVSHLDSRALATIQDLIERLVTEDSAVILDLMAGWDSHLPESLHPSEVVGLGLNRAELAANPALSETVIHDINSDPRLPLGDARFDVALCTVSIDYMTRPFDVYREVARVLKPGGLFLVTYSNRYFPKKVVKVWRDARDDERMLLVLDFFTKSRAFGRPRVFVSRGKPRPSDDKYAGLGLPSDPVYAIYAETPGGVGRRLRPTAFQSDRVAIDRDEIDARKRQIKHTLCCPYCDASLEKWLVPDSPFNEWPNEFFYVCFNDECAYFEGGWEALAAMGSFGSYRLMYDPLKDSCLPAPVLGPTTARG